jgi:hypothetical protein
MPFPVFSLPDSGTVKFCSGTIDLPRVSATLQPNDRTPASCF